jgi:hypothetical protein
MTSRSARAFWSGDLGFAIDVLRELSNCRIERSRHQKTGIAEFLEQSGRLPDLNGAPVASWVLSRLFVMTKGNLEIDETELLHNDGGCVWLDFKVFSRSFNPRGFLELFCYSNRINVVVQGLETMDAEQVACAFLDGLQADPLNLRNAW